MSEFFQMGGYAAYVWPAYGISALVLLGLVLSSLRANRKTAALVATLEGDDPVYSSAKPSAGPEPASQADPAGKGVTSPTEGPH